MILTGLVLNFEPSWNVLNHLEDDFLLLEGEENFIIFDVGRNSVGQSPTIPFGAEHFTACRLINRFTLLEKRWEND